MLHSSLLRSKIRALAIHLGISALIFLPFLYLIWFHWFRPPLFFTDGGWQGVRIMLLVDMVLGPALTFLIFNPAKTKLALTVDFGFISIVQAAALAYGAWSIDHNRVWAVVYSENSIFEMFLAVPKPQFEKQAVAEQDWKKLGDSPQYWVYQRRPRAEERAAFSDAMFKRGMPPEAVASLYEPLSENMDKLKAKALPVSKWVLTSPKFKELYDDFLAKHGGRPEDYNFFRLVGSYATVMIALDAQGRYVGYINMDPRSISR